MFLTVFNSNSLSYFKNVNINLLNSQLKLLFYQCSCTDKKKYFKKFHVIETYFT